MCEYRVGRADVALRNPFLVQSLDDGATDPLNECKRPRGPEQSALVQLDVDARASAKRMLQSEVNKLMIPGRTSSALGRLLESGLRGG